MTGPALRQALAFAEHGWPVFPGPPGQKIPATRHGYLDATIDPGRITRLVRPATRTGISPSPPGVPGPDVLDVDSHGPAASGFPALARLQRRLACSGAPAPGMSGTPSGGLHDYFTAHPPAHHGHLPATHVDFLAPKAATSSSPCPPQVNGKPYQLGQGARRRTRLPGLRTPSPRWLLEPGRQPQRPADGHAVWQAAPAERHRLDWRDWVARQQEGNRNAGLFWAANRALEASRAADLSPLAAAARQAGLDEPEITTTLNNARRTTTQAHREPPGHQAEGS